MSNRYFFTFGSGDPREFTGLSPTFVVFMDQTGAAVTAPPIVEVGISTGFYYASYMPSPTLTIAFLCDGGSSITDSSVRFLRGTIDPIASVDQVVGFTMSTFGTTQRPQTVFGLAQRIVEFLEADATFNKSSGAWNNYAKGTSTLLVSKTLANSTTAVSKE
jgi:hypothetical protein